MANTNSDPAYVHAVAGAIGGCVATIVTYPLMAKSARAANVRKRLGVEEPGGSSVAKGQNTQGERAGGRTSSIQSLLRSYTGLSTSLFGTTVSQGVYFYFYSLLRSFFVGRRGSSAGAPSVVESLGIAALAGMANVLLTNPIWVVATRLQTLNSGSVAGASRGAKSPRRTRSSASNLQVIKSVYADYGIPGFWNGCGASLIMVINPTIQYAIYEWLMTRSRQKKRNALHAPSSLHVFICSSIAKAGATLCTYPMLTIKTRMMSARRDQQYRGVADAVRNIYEREGVGGYFQGIETKILQSILGASVLLMIKEKITIGVRRRLVDS